MTPVVTRHPAAGHPHFERGIRRDDMEVRASNLLPGDIILVHSHGKLAPRLIGFGQRLHHKPEYAYWTHAAVYVGDVHEHYGPDKHGVEGGEIRFDALIEAKGRHPVRYVPLSQYDVRDYAAVRFVAPSNKTWQGIQNAMRANAVSFLEAQLGKGYEYMGVVNIALWSLLGGTRLAFGSVKGWFCSDLAAANAMYIGTVWDAPPLTLMPADIAEHFDIRA